LTYKSYSGKQTPKNMGKKRNANGPLAGKNAGKIALERPRRR
jgi:hypothetical protein